MLIKRVGGRFYSLSAIITFPFKKNFFNKNFQTSQLEFFLKSLFQ